jgi:tRNA-dihydrouridine synthase
MNNFWQDLKKPFFVLAPMDGVTDTSFRQLITKTARPDVLMTEFTSVEGLNSKGSKLVGKRLQFAPEEHPIVAQIWGLTPEFFKKSAQLIKELGYDGVDINMGCPVHDVIKTGACSAMINNHELAKQVIEATIEGAAGLPVSVKTRLGFKEFQTEEWFSFLLGFDLAVITVHGRTVAEQSKVPAHWDEIGKVVKLRDQINPNILIVGNGDIESVQEGLDKAQEFNLDGIMVGRGIFHDFWMFDPEKSGGKVTVEQRLAKLLEHTKMYNQIWEGKKDFNVLKKFYKIYASGFDGAVDLRVKLMATHSSQEVESIVAEYIKSQ